MLDLGAVVTEIEPMLRRLIGEDIGLLVSVPAQLAHIRADPSQIAQVILNLVVNARDAMPRGGALRIELANREVRASGPDVPNIAAGDYVELAIADTGIGMDRATLARVFEPFFTTKEPGRGTGLGLATVYGIVEQSGGIIDVESEPERGTRFRILVPRIGEPERESEGRIGRRDQ